MRGQTKRPDHRSPEAAEYRKLYKTSAWQRARAAQLAAHPLCQQCEEQGRITAATIVNHLRPHKGDPGLFFDPSSHQSLCKPHHDGPTQSFERTGVVRGCDADGNPIDPAHHWR